MTKSVPLCVDLDGTLIKTDLLLESFLSLFKLNPLYIFLAPFWLLRGKATLKAKIAERITLNAAVLPYREEFLEWVTQQRANGRQIWLCTAATDKLAMNVAAHLRIFDGVLASSATVNLSGPAKAQCLVEKFGEKGFDYCGDSQKDVAVWKHARNAVPVAAPRSVDQAARGAATVEESFPQAPANKFRLFLKALRLHQWAKNTLVFVPLITAHTILNTGALSQAVLAFISFGLCSSSAYLLNDMLDLEADRVSLKKRRRPFAAGSLSLRVGIVMTPVLLLCAFGIATLLSVEYILTLAVYFITTVAYSLSLKRMVLIDTMVLAGLYTIRVVAGANATGTPLSFWLLLFSIFLFLSLAGLKRYTELASLKERGETSTPGRGYRVTDLPLVQLIGISSGLVSVLVLALYLNSSGVLVLYHRPQILWGVLVLMLHWVTYMWFKAQRDEMHEDPVLFAVRDRSSIVIGGLGVVLLWLAA